MPKHDTDQEGKYRSFFSQTHEQDPDFVPLLHKHIATTLRHLALNENRIAYLHSFTAKAYEEPSSEYSRGLNPADEIVRATIVLSHAVLEDTLREIIRPMLSKCSAEVLDNVPLIGISPTGRPKRFSLGDLSKHRGKTVDELIQESTDEFLNHKSFNSSDDIADTLKMLGVDISRLEKYFAPLQELISRRHQIVHRADREDVSGSSGFAPINHSDLVKWSEAVFFFLQDLFVEIPVSQADPDKQTLCRAYLQEEFSRIEELKEIKRTFSELQSLSRAVRTAKI